MLCKHCGTKNSSISRFCLGCAVALDHVERQTKKKGTLSFLSRGKERSNVGEGAPTFDPLVRHAYIILPFNKVKTTKKYEKLTVYNMISGLLRIIVLVSFIILALILYKILVTVFNTAVDLGNLFDLFRGLTT